MARRISKAMEVIGYVLTPEFTPEPEHHPSGSKRPASPEKRLMQHFKSGAWILITIMLSLAIGQLN